MTQDQKEAIEQLLTLSQRSHYSCEDEWYSCPMSDGGCYNDSFEKKCNCGADEHNQMVTRLENIIKPLLEKSGEEIMTDTYTDTDRDKEFLQWLYDRLVNVYGENPNVDFVIKLRKIIKNYNKRIN